ncbi:MAG: ABC transporter permease [Methylophaga sp.]|nr:MAG: ABC transporter permease [Methylophaga sp.]
MLSETNTLSFPIINSQTTLFFLIAITLLIIVTITALTLGRYYIQPSHVIGILFENLALHNTAGVNDIERRVVELIRLPRVLLSLVAGAGLGMAGAALQSLFRNPLVGPDILGISPGAAFGGALAIMLFGTSVATVTGAFIFGLLAIVVVIVVAKSGVGTTTLTLVLSGVVVGAFFSALVSLVIFMADVESELPSILYWLLGSFASANFNKLLLMSVTVVVGGLVLFGLRYTLNVLTLGDQEAASLGINVVRIRWLTLAAVTIIVAASVAVAGVIGWIGLIVPHIARMFVGPDHKYLLTAAALIGAIALILVDTICRSLTAAEIPLSIVTAIAGAPVFILVLRRTIGMR